MNTERNNNVCFKQTRSFYLSAVIVVTYVANMYSSSLMKIPQYLKMQIFYNFTSLTYEHVMFLNSRSNESNKCVCALEVLSLHVTLPKDLMGPIFQVHNVVICCKDSKIWFCVKPLSELHRPAQHTSSTPTWPPPRHRKCFIEGESHNKSAHSENCDYRSSSNMLKLRVLVTVQQDDVTKETVGCVVYNYVLYCVISTSNCNFFDLAKLSFQLKNVVCDSCNNLSGKKKLYVHIFSKIRSHGVPL